MPYILRHEREKLDPILTLLAAEIRRGSTPETRAGLVNYAVTRLSLLLLGIRSQQDMRDIAEAGVVGEDYGYTDLNNLIGALECSKLELYRRVLAPYERFKVATNGDLGDE